jgi:hypothetical protein
MTDSYVIIGGANKSGTTSLFRYLADHPEVCSSRIKETDFFLVHGDESVDSLRTKYESLFQGCSEGAKVRLEASPGYMTEGARLAERMQQILPTAKLIFCLRDPVKRILSQFQRNKQSQFEKGMAMLSIHEFVDLLEKVVAYSGSVPLEGVRRNALLQFNRGCYATHLQEYRKYFPNDQMLVLMFDDLVGQTRNTVQDVCHFIGIDKGFYNDYRFRIENQARQYRMPILQKAGSRLGKTFEGVLNRAPYVRYALRKILLSPHAVPKNSEVCQSEYSRIESLYMKKKKDLAVFLANEYPDLDLPPWLLFSDP